MSAYTKSGIGVADAAKGVHATTIRTSAEKTRAFVVSLLE